LSQQGVVGLGGDAQDEFAELEFGLAEEVAVRRAICRRSSAAAC
jgi:hypothetical protein